MQIYELVLPSEFQLIFLKQNKIIVNDQLKEWAEVIWEDCGYNKLKLKYADGTFEKIDECLKDILHSITVEVIDIPSNIFTEIIIESFKNKPVEKYIYFNHQNCQANIIGFNKNEVIEKKEKLLNLEIKCEEELSIHERHILSGLNLFSWMEREFKGLTITVYGNKLTYEGHNSQVSKCRMKVYEIFMSIVKSELCLPLHAGMIINKEAVKEYLMEKLRYNNCVGSWEVLNGDLVLIYASGEKHLSILEKIMKQTFVANKLDFIQKIEGTSYNEKWLKLLENLKEEFQDLYFIGENYLSSVAVDSVANDIKSKIDNFRQSLTYASSMSIFLKQFNEQDNKEFCKKSKIKMCLKENKLYLEGTEDQIKEAEIFIENLQKDISSQKETFQKCVNSEERSSFLNEKQTQTEGIKSLNSALERSSFLNEKQTQTEGIISLNSAIESETYEILKFLYKKCTIELIEGDITTLNTDAIVNAANSRLEHFGGIAAAIVQKGGYEIQEESYNFMSKRWRELKTGDVVSTKPGNLKCKTIIHAVGPRWNNGNDQELFHLSKVVTNCLSFLEKHSYTSIAIPAISTGIYGIPVEEGIKCIVKSIKNYLDNNLSSNIKYICLIDIQKEVIRTFKLHLERIFKSSQTEFSSSNTFLPGPQQKTLTMIPETTVASKGNVDIEIKLVLDSISNASVDVIVNSSNEYLQLDNGSLSKCILNAAGPQIQDECYQKYPHGITISTIAVTKGYSLKCKNVFHVVLPIWNEDSSDEILQNLTQIITTCLQTADEMGAKSIAFPILGVGVLKYPLERLPRTMYEAVRMYSIINTSQIKVVYFVVFPKDKKIVKKFEEYFKGIHSNKESTSTDNREIQVEDNITDEHKDNGMISKFVSRVKGQFNSFMLTTEEVPLDIDLTEAQKHKIKNISAKDNIQINISDIITIHGKHSSHVNYTKISIQSLLHEFKKETYIKGMVQWYYFEDSFPDNLTMFNEEENDQLEKAYSQKKKPFEWKNIKYDIKNMCFQKHGKRFQMKRKQMQNTDMLPDTWSPMEDELFKIVELRDGKEYDDILSTFRQKLPSYCIIKIERIQNKTLYNGYQSLKRKFEAENPNITNEVHSLWHFPALDYVKGINENGFNHSYCDKNNTTYGEGAHFAKQKYTTFCTKYLFCS